MRTLKRLFLFLLSLLVILALISFLLPQKQHIERSTSIAASTGDVYSYISNPKSFHQWSPWAKLDPAMQYQFTGPESGEGTGMRWQSQQANVGNGSWVITRAEENQSIEMAMDFDDQGTVTSFFRLQPAGDTTKITWGFDTDAGMNPVMRWFGLLMDSMVGNEYEKGLATLKKMIEGKQAPA